MHDHTVSRLLESKSSSPLAVVAPDATVTYAVCLMNHHDVGAVVVIDGGKLAGIFTERDVLRRVIEPGLDPRITRVSEVHTAEPRTIAGDKSAAHALDVMVAGNFRHLPVVGNGAVLGTLSMRDLMEWQLQNPRTPA